MIRAHARTDRTGERGAYAILVVALFSMVALAIDLSDARSEVRTNASRSDFAALAAGAHLPADPTAACNAAWTYLVTNTGGPSGPLGGAGVASPCTSGVPAPFPTACGITTVSRTYAATGEAPFEIEFIFPINDGDPILEGRSGPDDGERCERFGVRMTSDRGVLFGGVVGSAGLKAPAEAVVRGFQGFNVSNAVALLLLDPWGCDALITSGQASAIVYAHNADNPGRISIDSAGTKSGNPQVCGNNKYTVNANDNNSARIWACGNQFNPALPNRCDPGGLTEMFAFDPGQTDCVVFAINHACDPNDRISIPVRLQPAPTRISRRNTRAPVDHEWNCNPSYPDYQPYGSEPPIFIRGCTASTPNYIDDLKAAVGTGTGNPPPGFSDYVAWYNANVGTGNACTNQVANTSVPVGNWFVNCTGPNGFKVNMNSGAGEFFRFRGGNIVFAGSVIVQGGELRINTNNPTANIPGSCRRPNDLCVLQSSENAAFVYLRSNGAHGNLVKNAQATLTFVHTAVILEDGHINVGAGSPTLTWTAPHEADDPNPGDLGSPFDKLALWSESTEQHTLGGQAPLVIEGVYFVPNALFNYDGQAAQFLDRAQFLTFRMNVSGQAALRMQPDPQFTLQIPVAGWYLIR